jgi:hypothetical protein
MRRRGPRLPWKRGPAAYKIKWDAHVIKARLDHEKRNFFSLRVAARILNVSTQPVRDWIRIGYLKRTGPRGQITRAELRRFIGWLEEHAEPFDPLNYLERLPRKYPFQKLNRTRFFWPKGRKALNPPELARLIRCHPSFIRKAIYDHEVLGQRRKRCRWEIPKKAWYNAFPFSFLEKPESLRDRNNSQKIS